MPVGRSRNPIYSDPLEPPFNIAKTNVVPSERHVTSIALVTLTVHVGVVFVNVVAATIAVPEALKSA